MLEFIVQKMRKKKWMVLSLLLGNLLMIAIAAASPMYSHAVLQRMLTQNLNHYLVETDQYPGTIILKDSYNGGKKKTNFEEVAKIDQLLNDLKEDLEVPVLEQVVVHYKEELEAGHEFVADDGKEVALIDLMAFSDVQDHVKIVGGEMFSGEIKDHTIDVIVNKRTLVEKNLLIGEVLELRKVKDDYEKNYNIRIAGVYENQEEQDPYWVSNPNEWKNVCLMDYDLFRELFANPEDMNHHFLTEWHVVLDHAEMQGDEAERYMARIQEFKKKFESISEEGNEFYFWETLEKFIMESKKLDTTIWVLQLPIFVLLAAFIFMVSKQMLEMEQNEIAVYKSRGANRGQIIVLYLLQGILIAAIGLAGGIPLGILICKVLGASNSFLAFVNRTALPVEMIPEVFLFAGLAAVFSIVTMVLPVIQYSNVNIVAHKRGKNRTLKRPWWQMVFLDIVLLGIALYGLYQFYEDKEYLAQKVLEGAGLDPLLYFSSSLFMIGAGLLVLRVFPLVVKGIFTLGKKWWSPAFYASFLRIIRTKTNQGFLMVFLILTVSMGIFNSQAARTINANREDALKYSIGADLVLQEKWKDNSSQVRGDKSGSVELNYEEPDFEKYRSMEGVEKVTKVLVNEGITVSMNSGTVENVRLMGINTKEFGEIAWMKEDLLPVHWYHYLNAIAQNAQAILVSSDFREIYGYEVGDVLEYSDGEEKEAQGVIYGFVDYWPSYEPITREKDTDGVYREMEKSLIVAHLSQIQSEWGVTPYQVWIKTEGSSRFIYDYAEENEMKFEVFEDTSAELINLKKDPVFQGTNGILTVGFICVLLLCITGFLIYWILSIQSRTLQFGIFRAMGMSMKEILIMLLNEQFYITGISIGAGVLVGKLTAYLYVPLLLIAYSSADQVLPLEVVSAGSDYIRLFAVIGSAILICMFILGGLISKIRISQALKLGED